MGGWVFVFVVKSIPDELAELLSKYGLDGRDTHSHVDFCLEGQLL
jgi:hypothetical protein